MKEYKILFSDDAKKDLRTIYNYIANTLLEPGVAGKQKNRILDGIRSLNQMPERGSLYDAEPWSSRGFRKLVVDNYLVFYVPFTDKNEVLVVRILYVRRDIDEALREIEL